MLYVPPIGAAAGAPYVDGNPAAGIEGSAVPAAAIEHVQREIVAAITAAGLVPSGADLAQLAAAIAAVNTTPVAALSFPEAESGTLPLVGAAVAGQGGKVTLAAGEVLTIAEELTAGQTGRMRRVVLPAYDSGNLLAASTYYVRVQIVAGAPQIYVQRGTDADAAPASLKGTPGAAAGGGFDTTALDALLARVVTGAAGTVPTVTALANRTRIRAQFDAPALASGGLRTLTHTLNWARAPRLAAWEQINVGASSGLDGSDLYLIVASASRYVAQTQSSIIVDSEGARSTGAPGYRLALIA